jgi:uncharacterized protein YabE (DUF348 family)
VKKCGFPFAGLLILSGAITLWLGLLRPVQVITPSGALTVNTRAWNVSRVLAQAGFSLNPTDAVTPALHESTGWQEPILIARASSIRIVSAEGQAVTLTSPERIPANLLLQAGLPLYPGDAVLLNGQPVEPGKPLPWQPAYALQIVSAQKLTVQTGGTSRALWSAAPTLGQALWAAGFSLYTADRLSQTLGQPLNEPITVTLNTAKPVTIAAAGGDLVTQAAGSTTAQALSESGLTPQGLDYTLPAEDEPLPASGKVQLVRVREEIALSQTVIPYESESIQDSNTEIGQTVVLEAGEYGLQVSRERVRYEDGLEVSRQTDAEWTAAEPKNELLGIGAKIVLKTLDTPSGSIEYWRVITATASSYSPCRLGNDTCNDVTASGMTLRKGIIAVDCDYFSALRGLNVYIPGYGQAVIADCGGGISGGFWVDLGFSDADYESWSGAVTVYFLPPVPQYIPYMLQ